MKLALIIPVTVFLANGAIAQTQSIPTTKEGAGAKPDSAESQSERIAKPPNANRPEAQVARNHSRTAIMGRTPSRKARAFTRASQPLLIRRVSR